MRKIELFENKRYETMFNDLNKINGKKPINDPRIKDAITKARRSLKKNDRIVWVLRWFKVMLLHSYLFHDGEDVVNVFPEFFKDLNNDYSNQDNNDLDNKFDNFTEIIQNIVDDMVNTISQKNNKVSNDISEFFDLVRNGYNINPTLYIDDILTQLTHYLSLPIAKINEHVFSYEMPSEIFNIFSVHEQKWKEQLKSLIDMSISGATVVKKFPDGFIWFNLEKPACGEEAMAMGHCGNSPRSHSNDTILSLREPIEIEGKTYWKPHLTFILDKNGYLGEMKGRGNDKPSSKYHKYIIGLLTNEIITGVKGGGYMPENNFAISDLSEEEQQYIISKNENLADYNYLYKKYGLTEQVADKILEFVHVNYPRIYNYNWEIDVNDKKLILHEYNSFDEYKANSLVDNDYNDSDIENIMNILSDLCDGTIETTNEFFNKLEDTNFDTDNLIEENIIKFDEDDIFDIISVLRQNEQKYVFNYFGFSWSENLSLFDKRRIIKDISETIYKKKYLYDLFINEEYLDTKQSIVIDINKTKKLYEEYINNIFISAPLEVISFDVSPEYPCSIIEFINIDDFIDILNGTNYESDEFLQYGDNITTGYSLSNFSDLPAYVDDFVKHLLKNKEYININIQQDIYHLGKTFVRKLKEQ